MDHLAKKQFDIVKRISGTDDPETMGTSGLLAWVQVGGGGYRGRYRRFRKATSIIKRRGLDTAGFHRQLVTETNVWWPWLAEEFARYSRKKESK